jgi:hypothetical protein
MLRHRIGIINSGRRPVRLLNTSGGKAVWLKHSCRHNFVGSSMEVCQVGIEHKHKAELEELCCEFRRQNL